MTIEDAMQVGLTLSSLIYVATAFTSTVYGIIMAKEREERALVREAVHHTWVSYVKPQKRRNDWGADERAHARQLALTYMRNNEARLARCFASSRAHRVSLIRDEVETRKSQAAHVRSAPSLIRNPRISHEMYEQL